MKPRPIQSKRRYVLSFVIGTIAFLLVFLISYSISYLEFMRISGYQDMSAYDIFEEKIDYSLFNPNFCSQKSFEEISTALGFQGRIIDDLERKLGKNDKRVLFRKKFYTLVELEHFDFVRTLQKECDLDMHTVLFFYSNEEHLISDSEDLGKLLSVFYERNPNMMIYSFDVNLDSELIEKLMYKYHVEEPLTVIINERYMAVNPKTIEELEKYLEE
jgi:hypothetical protein